MQYDIGTGRDTEYFMNVFLALSRLITAVFTGASHKVYFSAQSGRWKEQNKMRGKIFVPVLNYLFLKFKGDVNHCEESWIATKKVLIFEKSLKCDKSV